ncbi:MAG: rRNA maturation RNase YbeY [Candidatus Omnitrophica bacterium]|nr:rRNA maturation RNase YbeY [Candidatus Omnitrophota bacterium]
MALKIEVSNLNKKRKIFHKDIKKVALAVLKKFGKKSVSLDITFVNDGMIKKLNKKYMGKPHPTDVLAFGLAGTPLVGDIYISSDTAKRNSRVYGTGFAWEVILYTIHGVLHLMGMTDKTKKERIRIRKMETKILKFIK